MFRTSSAASSLHDRQGAGLPGGNRQIDVTVRSERGDGFSASQWRRHATLTLLVPRCQRVGIRGGLGQLKVRDLNAGLTVLGQGNRDYNAVYEVANLGGPLAADNIPIHRVDGVKGNVSVTATAYGENKGTGSGQDGVTARTSDPKESVYRDIDGDPPGSAGRTSRSATSVAGSTSRTTSATPSGRPTASWRRRPTTGSSRRAERSRCASVPKRRGA
ncbi:MAG: hypothetical protein WKF75_21735 [Singulisphaera sp.]